MTTAPVRTIERAERTAAQGVGQHAYGSVQHRDACLGVGSVRVRPNAVVAELDEAVVSLLRILANRLLANCRGARNGGAGTGVHAVQAVEHSWSDNVLLLRIKCDLHWL